MALTVSARRIKSATVALLTALAVCIGLPSWADPRQVADLTQDSWLRAVARLTIPTDRVIDERRTAQQEHCSAVLLRSTHSSQQRALLLTAWHCIEHYHNLAYPIEARVTVSGEEAMTLEARVIERGQDMESDWALLQLTQRIPALDQFGLYLAAQEPMPGSMVVMAGYSRDDGVGQLGEVLSFDAECQITAIVGAQMESDCRAHRGASGGAVVQLDEQGQAWLVGIISQGDGERRSYHTPLTKLREVLRSRL
jgi:V8-like Glu-specific endopeptidase